MFIDQQFYDVSVTAVKLLGIPSILCSSKPVDLSGCISQYSSDLPCPELFDMEIQRWKNRYMQIKHKERPSSAADAIKECDKVTSCECERSAGGLRRLNNFMRASMGKDHLSNLALLHIHDFCIDLDKVIDSFAKLHTRRLEFENIL